MTSAIYAFNDAQDAPQDREHPVKRHRPVAGGNITVRAARAWGVLLFVVGVLLVSMTGSAAAVGITLAYAALNLMYSLGAKNVALLDVFILSSGFVLRVLLGCALTMVVPSSWLLLCSYSLALFLALIKRRADLKQGLGNEARPSLSGYTLGFLDAAAAISAGMTLIAYASYCMEAEVLIAGREFAALPFVVFGVLDYLRVAHLKDEGGSPVDLILGSPALLAAGVGWAIATLWSLGQP